MFSRLFRSPDRCRKQESATPIGNLSHLMETTMKTQELYAALTTLAAQIAAAQASLTQEISDLNAKLAAATAPAPAAPAPEVAAPAVGAEDVPADAAAALATAQAAVDALAALAPAPAAPAAEVAAAPVADTVPATDVVPTADANTFHAPV